MRGQHLSGKTDSKLDTKVYTFQGKAGFIENDKKFLKNSYRELG